MNNAGNIENSAWLGKVSPVAWQHINLHGRYEFNKHPEPVNMNEIIQLHEVALLQTSYLCTQ
ncbi:MAG: Tn3 family transposase [Desulfobacter sp.]|nr:Tn3 family transposase [Desulfobacter sp.]MBP9598433.1 Tn3 family transposase [Desulfobacter sp.]HBT87257.1 hypothetical protein [Desulfobacter sp.]